MLGNQPAISPPRLRGGLPSVCGALSRAYIVFSVAEAASPNPVGGDGGRLASVVCGRMPLRGAPTSHRLLRPAAIHRAPEAERIGVL